MSRDYDRLLSVLYHVDISERQIARAAREIPEYNTSKSLLTRLFFANYRIADAALFRSRK
jgi:hypothetical protein